MKSNLPTLLHVAWHPLMPTDYT